MANLLLLLALLLGTGGLALHSWGAYVVGQSHEGHGHKRAIAGMILLVATAVVLGRLGYQKAMDDYPPGSLRLLERYEEGKRKE